MAARKTSRQVTFSWPFWVSGLDCRQAAGTYTVETEEVAVEALTFLAWKHIATVIRIAPYGVLLSVRIDQEELDDALVRDAGKSAELRALGESCADYDLL